MKKRNQHTPLSPQQLVQLSLHTCQWCEAVILQGHRFLDAVDRLQGALPWDGDGCSAAFHMDRLFLISAIHHAFDCLERLNQELSRQGDTTLQAIIDAIASPEERVKMKNLRNINEHDFDYLTGHGQKQNAFSSLVEKNEYRIPTNGFYTIIHGDAKLCLLGDVEINQLILRFKDNLPDIMKETKDVFNTNSLLAF